MIGNRSVHVNISTFTAYTVNQQRVGPKNHEICKNTWTQYGTNNFLGPHYMGRDPVVVMNCSTTRFFEDLFVTQSITTTNVLILMGDWCGKFNTKTMWRNKGCDKGPIFC